MINRFTRIGRTRSRSALEKVGDDFAPVLAPLLAGIAAGPAPMAGTLAGVAIRLRRTCVARDAVAHLLATGAVAIPAGGPLHERHR